MLFLFIAFIFILIGIIAGMASAMVGLGGGLVIVPVLYWCFDLLNFPESLLMHCAVGTSLMIIVITAVQSTYHHYRKGSILWKPVWQLLPSLVLGALTAVVIATHVNSTYLRYVFELYLLYTIIDCYFKKVFMPQVLSIDFVMPNTVKTNAFGYVVGLISTLLGVGGSIITMPFFRKRNLAMTKAVAMTTLVTLPISLVGALGYMVSGYHTVDLPTYSTGFIYWPAAIGVILGTLVGVPIGATLVYKISDTTLAKSYFVVLIMMFLVMLV